MKIAIVVGTRPEIIKMAPVMWELQRRSLQFVLVHSNQHYSAEMDQVFFDDLNLPTPHYNLHVGSGNHANQTGNILIKIEPIFEKEKPDLVLVQGDTNTVLAAALAASKLGIRIGHIEAGLRSYDRTMPEETNRVITDHMSDLLFAVTETQRINLTKEGVKQDKIHIVGNTVIDALFSIISNGENSVKLLEANGVKSKEYILVTAHRAGNVDDPSNLLKLVSSLNEVAEVYQLDIVFPVHPRTKIRLEKLPLQVSPRIKFTNALRYLDFVNLMANSRIILTDSGGVQEEACALNVPCVTLRENTERPETVDVGANVLTGLDSTRILAAVDLMLSKKTDWICPFGKGDSAKKIVEIIRTKLAAKNQGEIAVIGMGYMGLPIACLLADNGYSVTGMDIDLAKIERLTNEECPFQEAGLPELMSRCLKTDRLKFTGKTPSVDTYIISVPTPEVHETCDLRALTSAFNAVLKVAPEGALIIVESTIKPGTCRDILAPIAQKNGIRVEIAHCPERAIPGKTLHELIHNDRIIGGMTSAASDKASDVYASFSKGTLHKTDATTAECVKLLENTYRDVNIAVANEFDLILSDYGVDTSEAVRLANKHPRVNILQPGIGVGGHCIAVDPWFLIEGSKHRENSLIKKAREINNSRPENIASRIVSQVPKGATRIGVLGVTYKPDVDDTRESPVLPFVNSLTNSQFEVRCADPHVSRWDHDICSVEDLVEWAEVLVVAVPHKAFDGIGATVKPVFDNLGRPMSFHGIDA